MHARIGLPWAGRGGVAARAWSQPPRSRPSAPAAPARSSRRRQSAKRGSAIAASSGRGSRRTRIARPATGWRAPSLPDAPELELADLPVADGNRNREAVGVARVDRPLPLLVDFPFFHLA